MLYLKQGFDENYPLGFLTPANCVVLQTTERSSDGSPRYAQNPNAKGTYPLNALDGTGWSSRKDWTALVTKGELELAQKLEQIKKVN